MSRGNLLTNKLLLQGFQHGLKAPFRKFYGRYNDLVCPHNMPLSQILFNMFQDSLKVVFVHGFDYELLRLSDIDYWLTTGVHDRLTWDTYSSYALDPTSGISRVHVCHEFIYLLFSFLVFFFFFFFLNYEIDHGSLSLSFYDRYRILEAYKLKNQVCLKPNTKHAV